MPNHAFETNGQIYLPYTANAAEGISVPFAVHPEPEFTAIGTGSRLFGILSRQ